MSPEKPSTSAAAAAAAAASVTPTSSASSTKRPRVPPIVAMTTTEDSDDDSDGGHPGKMSVVQQQKIKSVQPKASSVSSLNIVDCNRAATVLGTASQQQQLGKSDRISKEKQKFFRLHAINSDRGGAKISPIFHNRLGGDGGECESVVKREGVRQKAGQQQQQQHHHQQHRKRQEQLSDTTTSCSSSDDDDDDDDTSSSGSYSTSDSGSGSTSSNTSSSEDDDDDDDEEFESVKAKSSTAKACSSVKRESSKQEKWPETSHTFNSQTKTRVNPEPHRLFNSFTAESSKEGGVWGFAAEAKKNLDIFSKDSAATTSTPPQPPTNPQRIFGTFTEEESVIKPPKQKSKTTTTTATTQGSFPAQQSSFGNNSRNSLKQESTKEPQRVVLKETRSTYRDFAKSLAEKQQAQQKPEENPAANSRQTTRKQKRGSTNREEDNNDDGKGIDKEQTQMTPSNLVKSAVNSKTLEHERRYMSLFNDSKLFSLGGANSGSQRDNENTPSQATNSTGRGESQAAQQPYTSNQNSMGKSLQKFIFSPRTKKNIKNLSKKFQ